MGLGCQETSLPHFSCTPVFFFYLRVLFGRCITSCLSHTGMCFKWVSCKFAFFRYMFLCPPSISLSLLVCGHGLVSPQHPFPMQPRCAPILATCHFPARLTAPGFSISCFPGLCHLHWDHPGPTLLPTSLLLAASPPSLATPGFSINCFSGLFCLHQDCSGPTLAASLPGLPVPGFLSWSSDTGFQQCPICLSLRMMWPQYVYVTVFL